MFKTLRNTRCYRERDVKIGDMVTPEEFYHNGRLKDSNGNMVDIEGLLEIWGKVVSINNEYHCSVRCTEMRFDNSRIIIPIKEKNQFTTSINFFRGSRKIK